MAEVLEIRREVHGIIDIIPERKLYILRPLLNELVDEWDIDDTLSSDERILLEKCRQDRKKHPENLTSWSAVKNSGSI